MQILDTQRLILRTMKEEDFDSLYENVFSNFTVVQNTFGSSMFSKEETVEFLKKNANFNTKLGLSTLVEKQTNSVIGLAGVIKCEYLDEIDYEIGFILQETAWGKGYAKEIGKAQISQIKDELNNKRAVAVVAPNNTGSIKTLESLGFKYIKDTQIPRGKRLVYSLDFK